MEGRPVPSPPAPPSTRPGPDGTPQILAVLSPRGHHANPPDGLAFPETLRAEAAQTLARLHPSQAADDADGLLAILPITGQPQILRRPGRPVRLSALPHKVRRCLGAFPDRPPRPDPSRTAHAALEAAHFAEALRPLGPLPTPADRIGLLHTPDGPLLWRALRDGGLFRA